MKQNTELLKVLLNRTINAGIGPSALRNQGSKNVVAAARHYLRKVNFKKLSFLSQSNFYHALDLHTVRMQQSFPGKARHWGAARKALNLILRDILYNQYLSRWLAFNRLENWLELPLDSFTAKTLRRKLPKISPVWKGIKNLTAEESMSYQRAAAILAKAKGIAAVHLDIFYWRS